jgi:hypothetical protein
VPVSNATFIGTWVVNLTSERDACLNAANNRGQRCFNLLAPYGAVTTVPPLSLATMLQSYTLNAAAVTAFLNKAGARGHEFLIALSQVTLVTLKPEVNIVRPNEYQFLNSWPAGTIADVYLELTDSDGDVQVSTVEVVLPFDSTPEIAAEHTAYLLEPLAFIDAMSIGSMLSIMPSEPNTTLVSTITVR